MAEYAYYTDALGVLDANSVGTTQITDLNVTTAKLADLSVSSGKLADLSVTTAKLADLNVTSGKLADLAVTNGKLAANAVDNAKLATDAVQTANILNLNVTTDKLADLSVTTGKIAGGAVDNAKLAANAVQTANITDLNVTTGKLAANAVTPAKADLTQLWSFSSGMLQVAGDPGADNDVTRRAYITTQFNQRNQKQSVRAATTAALPSYTTGGSPLALTATVNGALASIDGITLGVNDRLLVKNETSNQYNGIYTLTQVGDAGNPWILTRATDFADSASVTSGAFTFVREGTSNKGKGFSLDAGNTVTLNTTALPFIEIGSSTAVTAGDGLTKTGNELDVNAGDGLLIVGGAGTGGALAASFGSGIATVGTANAAGTATQLARADHVHSHGAQTDGSLHAAASGSAAGFLSVLDWQKLDRMQGPDKVQTTDATPTTVMTLDLQADETAAFDVMVNGRQNGGSENVAYRIAGLFQRTGGANAVQVGQTQYVYTIESAGATGWNVDFAISATQVVVQVTGAAATTIDWDSFSIRNNAP